MVTLATAYTSRDVDQWLVPDERNGRDRGFGVVGTSSPDGIVRKNASLEWLKIEEVRYRGQHVTTPLLSCIGKGSRKMREEQKENIW